MTEKIGFNFNGGCYCEAQSIPTILESNLPLLKKIVKMRLLQSIKNRFRNDGKDWFQI